MNLIFHMQIFNAWLKSMILYSDNNTLTTISGATLALFRIVYWLQLNSRVGPVVINITRVGLDLTTIISTYLATLIAFSLGIFFVLNSPTHSTINVTQHEHQGEEHSENALFSNELMVMFWAVLNPGPDPDTITDKGVFGIMANILFAIYQIILAIILLNLLIAMMNATTQKIADKKLLYWKFVRTSVWMDFISSRSYIPPPINLCFFLFLPLYLIVVTMYAIKSLVRKINRRQENISSDSSSKRKSRKVKRKCFIDPVEWERRKAHANLLQTLIKRYRQQDTNNKNELIKRNL